MLYVGLNVVCQVRFKQLEVVLMSWEGYCESKDYLPPPCMVNMSDHKTPEISLTCRFVLNNIMVLKIQMVYNLCD